MISEAIQYQTVLLDWDGNLVRTLDVWLSASRQVLLDYGFDLSDIEIGESFGKFPKLLIDLGIDSSEQGMAMAAEIAQQELHSAELYPGAISFLEYLKENKKQTALITSSSHDQVEGLLAKYSLRSYFDCIVTGESTKQRKPHPEPLHYAMKVLKANPRTTIMVGDSDNDILAATGAGVDSILFYPQEHKKFYDLGKLTLLKPTYTIQDFSEASQIIQ